MCLYFGYCPVGNSVRNAHLRQYLCLYRGRVTLTEDRKQKRWTRDRKQKRWTREKNIQTTTSRIHCKHSWCCPTIIQSKTCTQHLSLIRTPFNLVNTVRLVVCQGINGPLRQYFRLYRVVFQREEEKRHNREKGKKSKPSPTYCKHSRPLLDYNPNL